MQLKLSLLPEKPLRRLVGVGSAPGARQLPPFLPCRLCPLQASLWPFHRHRSAGGSVVTLYPVAALSMSPGTQQGNGVHEERALHPNNSRCSWARPCCLPLLCTAETREKLHGNLCRISGKLHRLRLLSVAEPIYVRWQYLGGAAGTGCTALPVQPVALTVKKLNSNSSGTKQLINILKSQACSNVKPHLLH